LTNTELEPSPSAITLASRQATFASMASFSVRRTGNRPYRLHTRDRQAFSDTGSGSHHPMLWATKEPRKTPGYHKLSGYSAEWEKKNPQP